MAGQRLGRARAVPPGAVLPLIFAAVFVAHWPLLRLPYYWDEAGYYIPAALDFFHTGALIPFSTLSNAHPPLPSIYLALWWKVFHFTPFVTRTAMCLIAAVALTAVWRLAMLTTGKVSVAAATVLLTALYPVFFAQSSLAHADLFAAAATLWALTLVVEEKPWAAAGLFMLAALSKETAIATPLALAVWESWRARPRRRRLATLAALLSPTVPLAAWYVYHWRKAGYIFGNPQYVRYNATATIAPERILLALGYRLMHITLHMNLFVPVAAMLACLLLPPVAEDPGAAHPRLRAAIAPRHQALFAVVIVANLALFSVLGGALLTRYLLPLYPLVLLLAVSTFRRRLREWSGLVALSAAAFIAGLFVNPPYRFAPEDNLQYVTVIHLQQAAIHEIVTQLPGATVLTAWPATDELTKPELGYVSHPVPVVAIDNFSAAAVATAASLPQDYDAALVFSTKYDPPRLPFLLGQRTRAWDTRYFDFHRDLTPPAIARVLDGTIMWGREQKGQWAAVLRLAHQPGARNAILRAPRASSRVFPPHG